MEKQNQDLIISLLRDEIPENNNVYFILYQYLTPRYASTSNNTYYHELFKSRSV